MAGLLRRRGALVFRNVLIGGRMLRALVIATPECIERCCDDGPPCTEVIRFDPCRSHSGPPDNPCSSALSPVWVCADSYCINGPIIDGARETFADSARQNKRVTILIGTQCYTSVPSSLRLRSELSEAEASVLLTYTRRWSCVPAGCVDPMCTDGYDPCACLCWAILSADGQSSYFCCYGRIGQNGIPPRWSTEYTRTFEQFITVEHIAGGTLWGQCDLGRTEVVNHLMRRITERGRTDGTWAGPCRIGGEIERTDERFCLPAGIDFGGCNCVPSVSTTTQRTEFAPGHGRIEEIDTFTDYGGDDVCRSSVRRSRRQTAHTCDAWAWTDETVQVSCTSGVRLDGTFGPIARITVTERDSWTQTWRRPYDGDCGACESAMMAAQSASTAPPHSGVLDPGVRAAILRQTAGCRGCGDSFDAV